MDMYVSRNMLTEAMLVAQVDATGGYDAIRSALYINVGDESERPPLTHSKAYLHEVLRVKAERFFTQGQPVLAACTHLTVSDAQGRQPPSTLSCASYSPPGALQKLLRGNEVELGTVLVRLLRLHPSDHVITAFAAKCRRADLWCVPHYCPPLRILTATHIGHLPWRH